MSVIGDAILSLPDEVIEKVFKNGTMVSEAQYKNKKALDLLECANEDYIRRREKTVDAINDLNLRKLKVINNEFNRFVNIFSQIANINESELTGLTDIKTVKFTMPDYKGMKNEVIEVYDFVKTGTISLAISGLFGIGGIMIEEVIASKNAKTALNNANRNVLAAESQIQILETEKVELDAIYQLAKQQDKIIRKLAKLSRKGLDEFEMIASKKKDWDIFTVEEKKTSAAIMTLMKLIKEIINLPILTDKGVVNSKIKKLDKNKDLIDLGIV